MLRDIFGIAFWGIAAMLKLSLIALAVLGTFASIFFLLYGLRLIFGGA